MFFQYIAGDEKPLQRVMSEYLFDATFIVTANVIASRSFLGFGLSNLTELALFSGTDAIRTRVRMTEKDITPEEIFIFF